jgi:ABC-2 type transport system ATP-binding protein
MTVTAAIDAVGLVKNFGQLRAVDGIDLDVRQGEIFGVLDPNGAGKTTMLKMLATLLPIDAGQARVFGVDVAREPHARRGAQPVPGTVPDDRVGTARVSRSRDEDLQAFYAAPRCLVSPDEFHELFGPHRTAATRRLRRQQRLRPIARDRFSLPAHVGEQVQGDRHPVSLRTRRAR